jgi:Secretion system C-terminal sorting domain
MKKITILTFFTMIWVTGFSQTLQPEFEFKLYGEDSKGNKDSVIIGYHHDASTDDVLDTRFGDKNTIDSKFNPIFEMRVHKVEYLYVIPQILAVTGVSKRITLYYKKSADCVPYGKSRYGFLLMKVKYPPVKLYWDKEQFDKGKAPCVGRSYLVNNEYFTQEYPPELVPFTVYMSENGLLVDSLREKTTQYINGFPNYTLKNVKITYPDGTRDTLQSNYQFQFQNTGIRSATIEQAQSIKKIYPNPCQEQLNLLLPSFAQEPVVVNVYGLNGALLQAAYKYSDGVISIDTTPLSMGQYVVNIITKDDQHFLADFIKSD